MRRRDARPRWPAVLLPSLLPSTSAGAGASTVLSHARKAASCLSIQLKDQERQGQCARGYDSRCALQLEAGMSVHSSTTAFLLTQCGNV